MKQPKMILLAMLLVSAAILPNVLNAQKDNDRIMRDSRAAKAAFIKTDGAMAKMFSDAYGYAIFPNVGKGGVIVGGAGGNGTVYESGKAVGTANMVQATVGAQIGGKAYREVIFLKTKMHWIVSNPTSLSLMDKYRLLR